MPPFAATLVGGKSPRDGLVFHLGLTAVVSLSIWMLLGRGNLATAAAAVSLLPLFLLFAYCGFASWKNGTWEFTHLIPFLAGWIGILGMRNYLAHHPWVASPIVMLGIIFSLALILPGLKKTAPAVVPCSLAPAAFIYCYRIVMFLGVNDEGPNRIVTLVCRNTERGDAIIISASRDPDLFKCMPRWSLQLDRKVFEEAEWKAHPLTAGSRSYQLTLTPNETLGSPINSENSPVPWGQPAIKKSSFGIVPISPDATRVTVWKSNPPAISTS